MTTPGRSTILPKARCEALSDGVFAIVLTLLVLELKVPDDAAHLGEQLRASARTFFGYFITFTVGGLFWYLHHNAFRVITHLTPRIVVANLAFLGCVSLLPFTMACFGRFPGQELPTQLYLGNLCSIGLALAATWLAARRAGAIAVDTPAATLADLQRRILALPLASALGLLVSTFAAQAAPWAFVLALLAVRFVGRRRARRVVDARSTR